MNTTTAAETALPTVEAQLAECRRWRDWFRAAGYDVQFSYTGERDLPEGFDKEWQVWTADGKQVGSFDIDGTGASWHGEDDLWLKVVGPHVDLIAG